MKKALKKKETTVCDNCGASPADTTMTIGGVTINGKRLKKGRTRKRLCDECTAKTMRNLSDALIKAAEAM